MADPAVCTTTPLTVKVNSWPSATIGKSAAVYYTASQPIVTAVVKWVPRLQLVVEDARGCHATVVK